MKVPLKKMMAVLLIAIVLASSVFGATRVGIKGGGGRYGFGGLGDGSLNIAAPPDKAAKLGVGGVLFQEIAVPVPGTCVEGKSVKLEYKEDQPDGHRLVVTIGDTVVTTELYDWQLIPTARFAASEYTSCMTLLGKPKTDEEMEFFKEHRKNGKLTRWIEFHPELNDTLVGMNLFFIDAMLIDRNPNPLREITDAFDCVVPGYNDTSFDKVESANNAKKINRLMGITERVNFAKEAGRLMGRIMSGSLYKYMLSSYIYTDNGSEIQYKIRDGKLEFSGVPSYQILWKVGEDYTVNVKLTNKIRQNIECVRGINPIIYDTAEKTAQWAAFFRMVKEKNPENWKEFTDQIRNVEPEVQIQTPRYWIQY